MSSPPAPDPTPPDVHTPEDAVRYGYRNVRTDPRSDWYYTIPGGVAHRTPEIDIVQPGSAEAGSASTLVVAYGANFTGAYEMRFGDVVLPRANWVIDGPASCRGVAPSTLPPGTVDMTVTNGAGSGSHPFTFTEPPPPPEE